MTQTAPGTEAAADPLSDEILRHALRVAAEEASIVVVKSAHSAMIVEGADACAGILDHRARLVALSTATNRRWCSPAVRRPGRIAILGPRTSARRSKRRRR